jgi:aromatic-amino-acid transaminase
LAAHGRIDAIDLGPLADGLGLFAMLALSASQIDLLQSEFGIYMAPSGRVNVAGMAEHHVECFVAALRAVQRKSAA